MTSIKTLCSGMTARHWQWLFFALFVVAILMMPALADNNAQGGGNPLSGISIAGSDKKDLNSMFGFFIKLIIVSIPFVILIYAFSGAILSVFASLAQARRDGDIGAFFFNLLIVLIGVGITIFLGYYMFELLGKFDAYWPKS